MTVNNLAEFVLQLLLFALVPSLWWRWRHRDRPFLAWLGLKRPQLQGSLFVLVPIVILYLLLHRFDAASFVDAVGLDEANVILSRAYTGMGWYALLPALVAGFLQTGLTEELLFRGFVAKRAMQRWGFGIGNIVQAILFGALHNLLFLAASVQISVAAHLVLFVLAAVGGGLLALLNERVYNGSIWPSVLLHGAGNVAAILLAAFA